MKAFAKAMAVFLAGWAWAADAQTFNAGSDGSYGPINVTSNTVIELPVDGVFRCTTMTVGAGRTLTFRRNALNTAVVVLATGDVRIDGAVDLNGKGGNNVTGGEGGPGGFDGGNPGSVSTPPGAGYGPGAGRGGTSQSTSIPASAGPGSYSTLGNSASTNRGEVYGNALLIPVVGGSGGGGTIGTPGLGGGGGGGGILIASNTRIDLAGTITTDGGGNNTGVGNGGSGGSVRLVAPVVAGSGAIRAFGGSAGGGGRIRIDTLNRSALNIGFSPSGITSIGSMMIATPSPAPRLDIVEAAGTAIQEGSGPVFVQLPFGSAPERVIKVQARDFNDIVPITVQLTPDNGAPITYQAQIDNKAANPGATSVNVTLPVNVQVAVQVWTR